MMKWLTTTVNLSARCLSAVLSILRDWTVTFLKALGIVLTFVIVLPILVETFRPVVRIDAFALPHDYEERGFTAQAFGNELMDAIEQIKTETKTSAKKETFSLAASNELPDFELPDTKLSLRAIAQSLQEFLHLQPPHVSGEIMALPDSEPKDDRHIAPSKNTLLVTVRVTDNDERTSSHLYLTTTDPQTVVSDVAEEVVRIIDPYISAARMYGKRQPEEALKLLDQCRGDLMMKWCWSLRGLIFTDERNYSRAESAFKTSLFSIQPDCRKFWLRGDYARICEIAYNNWGLSLYRKGDDDGVIAKCQKAAELDPKYADAYVNWGNALYDKGDHDGAFVKYQKALELDPKNVEAYNDWGLVLYRNGDYDGAVAKYQKALELDPKYANAYINWGLTLYHKGDDDGAVAKYQKAIEFDPKYANAYNDWGLALDHKGDHDDAVAKYQKAIEFDPKYANAYMNWGTVLYRKGDYDGAIAKYQKAVELDPKDVNAYNDWGVALYRKGDDDGAIAKCQKAAELDPKYANAYINWGNALYLKGDHVGSVVKYQKALELDPKNVNAYMNWGNVLYRKGDYDGAIAKARKALELGSRNSRFKQTLDMFRAVKRRWAFFLSLRDRTNAEFRGHRIFSAR
jgi:tetratricopeptide (TPR) repeat protein